MRIRSRGRSWGWPLLLMLLSVGGSAGQEPAKPAVDVQIVNYGRLGQTLRQLRGKVVVVDFWRDDCVPCKREFPHLVELHAKLAKDGLAAVSVNLDDPSDKEVMGRVKKFLEMKQAAFTNLVLDEKPELWQAKFKSDAVPFVYVFNRAGEWQKFEGDALSYERIGKLVDELLKQK
jgi:thiol-disulfide isomerase/thioredoxin